MVETNQITIASIPWLNRQHEPKNLVMFRSEISNNQTAPWMIDFQNLYLGCSFGFFMKLKHHFQRQLDST